MAIEVIAGPRVAADALRDFATRLLAATGADADSAAATARAIVDASSRAFDTHGIRLLPYYLQTLEGGRVKGHPAITVTRKAQAVVHVDADDGFGHAPSFRAVDTACDVAAETGVAVATVARSSHHGATGCYTRAAALRGFVAIGMTHADAVVVPHGGTQAFFGTNPLSFALPVTGEDPMVLDMATSAIPFNRVLLRRATGTPLPPEVARDAEGELTTDPNAATALVPLGGATFGYKGAGLAGMVDLLCSALTGMGHGKTLALFTAGISEEEPHTLATSSMTMQAATESAPSPPNRSGTCTAWKPAAVSAVLGFLWVALVLVDVRGVRARSASRRARGPPRAARRAPRRGGRGRSRGCRTSWPREVPPVSDC